MRAMKKGFTLMEVNLAIFIMATGILAMVSLYPLGFRENEQSLEDVAGAAIADEILNPLVMGLSSTNITWQAWTGICGGAVRAPNGGWQDYFINNDFRYAPKSMSSIRGTADGVIGKLQSAISSGDQHGASVNIAPASGLAYALVVTEGTQYVNGGEVPDRQRLQLCLRVARRAGQLMSAPIYYTEVRFQGDPAQQAEGGR